MDKSTKILFRGQPSAKTIKIPLCFYFLFFIIYIKWSSYFISLKTKKEKKEGLLRKRPQ